MLIEPRVERAWNRPRWFARTGFAPLFAWACVCVACGEQAPRRRVQDCTPSEAETRNNHPKSEALAKLLERAVGAGLPGAQMAVDQAGFTWFGAAGVPDLAEPQREFEVCHQTTIKSITKSFVAVRAMQMVGANELELGATLQELLPGSLLEGLPNTDRITLRHLLNHTSGLVHYPEVVTYILEFLNQPTRSHSVAEALDAVRGLEPYFAPGTGFHYSNTNTLLLEHIIEHRTGRTLERELRAHVWEPVGLEHTHLHQHEPLSLHVPVGYMDLHDNGDAHEVTTLDDVSSGSGGIESTLLDLVRFSRALLRDQSLVDVDTLAAMTDAVATDEERWGFEASGLGLSRWETPLGEVWGHTGEDTGYKAYWHYAPDFDLTWVLLLNSNYGQFAERAKVLRAEALGLLAD